MYVWLFRRWWTKKHNHQKARDLYANMPLDKMAELNARKRKNYHRRKVEKQSEGWFKLSCLIKLTCLFKFKCLFNNRDKNNLWMVYVAPLTHSAQPAMLHVSGAACLTTTPQIAVMHCRIHKHTTFRQWCMWMEPQVCIFLLVYSAGCGLQLMF